MTKDSREHLSSLMDGELSHETSLFVARRLGSDEELGKTWGRYHLVRECLRRPGGKWALTSQAFELDAAALSKDPAHKSGMPGWMRPVAGVAIAASVAVVAVLLAVPANLETDPVSGPQAQPFSSPNPLSVGGSQPASFSGARAVDNRRLKTYLLRHQQVAGTSGTQGFVNFVPVVTAAPVQVLDSQDLSEEDKPVETVADTTERP